MTLHSAPSDGSARDHLLHSTSIADLPDQLLAAQVGRCLTAIDLLRCQRVDRHFYCVFAFKPLDRLKGQTSADVLTSSDSITLGHSAWVGSTWRPTNTQLQHCFHSINWESLALLEHLDLSQACRHLRTLFVIALVQQLLPRHCSNLRSLKVNIPYMDDHYIGAGFVPLSWQNLTRLEDLHFLDDHGISTSLDSFVSNNPRLHTLALNGALPTVFQLSPHLKVLQLAEAWQSRSEDHPDFIRGLASIAAGLVELSIGAAFDVLQAEPYNHVSAIDELLPACTSLQSLRLDEVYLPNSTLETISNIGTLRVLRLTHCFFDKCSSAGLLLVHQIHSLSIEKPADHPYNPYAREHHWTLSTDMLRGVVSLPALTSLSMNNLRVKSDDSVYVDWGLQWMPALPKLQTLKLSGEGIFCSTLDGELSESQPLCRMLPNLTELQMPTSVQIDDLSLDFLATGLPALTSLGFRPAIRPRHYLTAAGLSALAKLSQLQRLDVSLHGSVITVPQLLHCVSQQPALTSLSFACDLTIPQLDGKSLRELIPHIRNLSIDCRPSREDKVVQFVYMAEEPLKHRSIPGNELLQLVALVAELPMFEEFSLTCKLYSDEAIPDDLASAHDTPDSYPTVTTLFRRFTEHSYHLRPSVAPAQCNIFAHGGDAIL